MGTLYRANGKVEEVKPKQGKHFSLEEMQAMVGGYIEAVPLGHWRHLVVNEDGKGEGLPCNTAATELFLKRPMGCIPGDYIAGDALLTERGEGLG